MSEKPEERKLDPQLQEELEAERELRAKVHRWLGTLSAVLVLVAMVVALNRIGAQSERIGFSPWEALGLGATAMPWVLLILGLGVVFSMGTSRVMWGIEKLINLITGKKKAG